MLSIIICTYNRDKYIYNVLKSIADNDFSTENYEIVLVNNNSTDSTKAECSCFAQDYSGIQFRYFEERNQGLSYARNRGIEEAQGDILVYVDDDATVNAKYLQTYSCFFEKNPEAMAAGGAIIPVYETEEPKWFSHYIKVLLTGYLYHGEKIKKFTKGKFPGGGNAAYRKKVFYTTGLFNVNLGRRGNSLVGAEEKDIFDKMTNAGMKFYYLPDAILYHIIPSSKLSKYYFNRLTYSIGQSERLRTLELSKTKYLKRLLAEGVKWAASVVLCLFYILRLSPQKGFILILFRWNVTKGLLQKKH
ncbi:MAG: glycosyltransferase [Prevotellaceae bacterium]|jgi:glycosyltransferase involved in cell wall biosynthesis|nr:glycosyltransferase [Prevotellaceae bacterium]